ncbi:transglutaminase domain-containing protein [Streptomyces mangrovisoli]|uniref:Transglutaminase-like domain-containing protein n=1 Tax=Streptomyces mangrovisoli TaxID=1428628 RepID=A0A1J4P3R0_9ACTN|nr:transglutaminase domain-containing protein [Streptomyces mangrovisoli]OIJ68094.1 hypothetical protein WN71_009875 [Streptomyces mangrovisoli]
MTSSLLMPRCRTRSRAAGHEDAPGGTAATRILDRRHPEVRALLELLAVPRESAAAAGAAERTEFLRRAHRHISARVRPVYSVQDERPVSQVLRRGRGSCSQRLAVLEAVARAAGTPTRVRGLLLDGRFWYPRFPRLHFLVPHQVVLPWPEFRIEGLSPTEHPTAPWLSVSDLFGRAGTPGDGGGFTNSGAETLFDAVARTAVDWDGATACSAGAVSCDLSAHVLADLGHFASRDDLFARHGQTLCATARLLAEPVLGRHAAGA